MHVSNETKIINLVQKIKYALLLLLALFSAAFGEEKTFQNPVIYTNLADPTVVRADDGYFYVYATEDIRNIPIFRSEDLVSWQFMGRAFTDETRPTALENGNLWAPDITYINGKYVLYYSMALWGQHWLSTIGRAVSDGPEGPFKDLGKLFDSREVNVENSIDQFIYVDDDGSCWIFWGSFYGLFAMELTKDGLNIKEDAEKVHVAGNAYEAVAIHKRGKYYYMLASIGSCCAGEDSTYTTVVGRSENLLGPYVNKNGELMLDNKHEVLIHRNGEFIGTGHNADIVTDDAGKDWILYHAFRSGEPGKGRLLMLSEVKWEDGWPYVENSAPAEGKAKAPVFNRKAFLKKQAGKQP